MPASCTVDIVYGWAAMGLVRESLLLCSWQYLSDCPSDPASFGLCNETEYFVILCSSSSLETG